MLLHCSPVALLACARGGGVTGGESFMGMKMGGGVPLLWSRGMPRTYPLQLRPVSVQPRPLPMFPFSLAAPARGPCPHCKQHGLACSHEARCVPAGWNVMLVHDSNGPIGGRTTVGPMYFYYGKLPLRIRVPVFQGSRGPPLMVARSGSTLIVTAETAKRRVPAMWPRL